MVEILTNFNFYVYFLAAFWLSVVHLYADENQTTTSASKCDSPCIFCENIIKNFTDHWECYLL